MGVVLGSVYVQILYFKNEIRGISIEVQNEFVVPGLGLEWVLAVNWQEGSHWVGLIAMF